MNETVKCQSASKPVSKRTSWRRFEYWFVILTFVGFVAMLIGSQIVHIRRIEPVGVTNVDDYFARFGNPIRVAMVENNGRKYYEFTGSINYDWIVAFAPPSGPPAYVFDEQGALVAWCSDTGDADEFHRTWRAIEGEPIDIAALRRRFAR